MTLLIYVEGGYILTEPPEGPTFAGILKSTWDGYWRAKGDTPAPWPPHPAQVASFYLSAYWTPYHCDEMPEPLDAVFLQLLVNLPPQKAVQILQCCVRAKPDGKLGPNTLGVLRAFHVRDICDSLLIAQRVHYCAVRALGDPVLQGLLNRVDRVHDRLLQDY